MSVIYPQISKPGGFGTALCAGIYSPAAAATPTCFCIYRLWQNPVAPPHPHPPRTPPPAPLPNCHPSVWMHSTSRSSICFCPPMKRPIIICRMHSWRAASSTWARQRIECGLWIQRPAHPPHAPASSWSSGTPVRDLQLNKFLHQHCPRVGRPCSSSESLHSEWLRERARPVMPGSWLTLEWLANVIEGGPPGCSTVQSAATEGPE